MLVDRIIMLDLETFFFAAAAAVHFWWACVYGDDVYGHGLGVWIRLSEMYVQSEIWDSVKWVLNAVKIVAFHGCGI